MNRAERRFRTENKQKSRIPFLNRIYNHNFIPGSKYGRCRNHHPHDCGYTKCIWCHYCKVYNVKPLQEKRYELDMKEYKEII